MYKLAGRFTERWYYTIALVFVVLLGAVSLKLVVDDQREIRKLQEFDARRGYDLCVADNNQSKVISDAIEKVALDGADALAAATASQQEGGVLTPEQEQQLVVYKDDIRRRVGQSLESLKPRDCEELYPKEGRGGRR